MMEVQGMTSKEGKEKLVAHFPNNIKSILAKGSRQLSDNQVSKIIFKQPKNLFNLKIKKSYLNSRSTRF